MKIGITGSLSSGKSSVVKILSKNKKVLFSADKDSWKSISQIIILKKLIKKFKIKKTILKMKLKLKF